MKWQHSKCKESNITTESIARIEHFSAFYLIYNVYLPGVTLDVGVDLFILSIVVLVETIDVEKGMIVVSIEVDTSGVLEGLTDVSRSVATVGVVEGLIVVPVQEQ